MVSVRKALLPALAIVDTVPAMCDLRPTSVEIVTRVWARGRRGDGDFTDKILPIITRAGIATPTGQAPVRVRHITQHEIDSSGGRFEEGDVRIGPIRPVWQDPTTGARGGYTEQQLRPHNDTQGVETIYRLRQIDPTADGISGDHALVALQRDKALRFILIVGRERGAAAT